MKTEYLGYPKRCPICGKVFTMFSPEWAYKTIDKHNRVIFYCSWHCLCEKKRRMAANSKALPLDMQDNAIDTIKAILHSGYTTKALAKELGRSPITVTRWLDGTNIMRKTSYRKLKNILDNIKQQV